MIIITKSIFKKDRLKRKSSHGGWFKKEQGAQWLQTFAFCVLTVNDEHTKPRFKRKPWVKYQDGMCAKLCLKLWFKCDWYFCKIKLIQEAKFQITAS